MTCCKQGRQTHQHSGRLLRLKHNRCAGIKGVFAVKLTQHSYITSMRLPLVLRGFCGAIAQLGERNTGSVEVVGSIPSGSTIQSKTYPAHPRVLREVFSSAQCDWPSRVAQSCFADTADFKALSSSAWLDGSPMFWTNALIPTPFQIGTLCPLCSVPGAQLCPRVQRVPAV